MRLSKFLAHSGYCSRREAEQLIQKNKVIINGNTCNDFSYQVKKDDEVFIGKTQIKEQRKIELYALNKPRGYITSKKDELDRKTVYDLLPLDKKNLLTIGRLDFNTEGLLLFTNNGEHKRYFELPKNKITRTYEVKVYGNINSSDIEKIEAGITINGIKHQVKQIILIKKLKTNNWLRIKLVEGKNREIRKIFESLGFVVNRIIRTHYGSYSLNKMKRGEFKKMIIKKI
jgi:23S rRNA pseudouridine2605 synthase|tara:strand:- start:3268 stop:3954 length:687 start_codon:yes stop_codon:yes gene_type:complete